MKGEGQPHLNKVTTEATVAGHGTLQVNFASDSEGSCSKSDPSAWLIPPRSTPAEAAMPLTEICPREGLVGQADSEMSLDGIKLGHGQADSINGDGISNRAIPEDRGRLRDDKAVAFERGGRGDVRDSPEDLPDVHDQLLL